MSGIRGWWQTGDEYRIAGVAERISVLTVGMSRGQFSMDRSTAEALHRATPEDPDEAKAVADVLGQVAVVTAMRLALPEEHPLRKAIEKLAELQKTAINERARVARQQPKEGNGA